MKKYFTAVMIVLALALAAGPVLAQGRSGSIVRVVGNIHVPEGERIEGDVVSIVGNVEINGEVTGNVVSIIGKTTVSGTGKVWGDAVSIIGGLSLLSGSEVLGSQVSIIGNGVDINIDSWHWPNISWRHRPFRFNYAGRTFSLAMGVLISTLLAAAFPLPLNRVGQALQQNPARLFLLGVLGWLAGILLTLAFLVTIIGIPVSLLLILGLAVATWFGRAAAAMVVGAALLKNRENLPAATALGALLLWAVALIPTVGGLVSLVVSVIAMGAVLLTRFGTQDAAGG